MKEVVLQLPSLEYLWQFKASAKAQNLTVIAGKAILMATLPEDAIEAALTTFQATRCIKKPLHFL